MPGGSPPGPRGGGAVSQVLAAVPSSREMGWTRCEGLAERIDKVSEKNQDHNAHIIFLINMLKSRVENNQRESYMKLHIITRQSP